MVTKLHNGACKIFPLSSLDYASVSSIAFLSLFFERIAFSASFTHFHGCRLLVVRLARLSSRRKGRVLSHNRVAGRSRGRETGRQAWAGVRSHVSSRTNELRGGEKRGQTVAHKLCGTLAKKSVRSLAQFQRKADASDFIDQGRK